mmetsp:Transcript_42189/g.121925  ORF Transcript_42189/g.121925 Transcript_42189/m.121925 type:complete len:521 (+) Transcript_42189:64-1626(+)
MGLSASRAGSGRDCSAQADIAGRAERGAPVAPPLLASAPSSSPKAETLPPPPPAPDGLQALQSDAPVRSHSKGSVRGGSGISALKVKAMAVRLRHNAQRGHQYSNMGGYAPFDPALAAAQEEPRSDTAGLMDILAHPLSLLLLAFPLGIASHVCDWGPLPTFWLNMIALVPLAKILGDGTEELASAIKNDTISGLLNATLGNAVEMILSVQTLRKGLLSVVKATLLGSILSNILLVLGTSFFLGGLVGSSKASSHRHFIHIEGYRPVRFTMEKEQLFNSKNALVDMAMQLLACMTCALPTVFVSAGGGSEDQEQKVLTVSRIGAVIIMCSYIAYIGFQLVTHKRMLAGDEGEGSDDEDDEEAGGLSAGAAIGLMSVTTVLIAICSELLVEAIDHVVKHCGIPERFIGIVLLPFAGNACEHASAVRFAMQDRLGLSIGIAVGSSTQIALFVVPFAVVTGWAVGQEMDLVFGAMNTAVMILAVLVVLVLVIDGRSNWLKGFMLCMAYVFCGVLYWYMPPPLH